MRKFQEKKFFNAASNTDFYDCVDNIFADYNILIALDLGKTANECICNIANNVLQMNDAYNKIIKFLLKECA